ncbi:hypothetical protein SAMN05428970_1473 [Agromyces sp. CF514]|uniref:hypothetical protein n=1 Tax=Agromyces sp. CF514 TaxID=1881031 RepID=UPI0008E320E1|nr:hypothetical protein [Agromyces sp. CF514]SFR72995.1 hypothetical protein SAMN05428970_1473 [Agromyces sp. CF514]
MAIESLEAVVGSGLVSGAYAQADPIATVQMPAAVGSAGGFSCSWSDAATGAVRVSLTVVPDAVDADERIIAEFAAREGTTPVPYERTLHTGCISDHCEVEGFIGTTAVNLYISDMPWADSGSVAQPQLVALRDEISDHLGAVPPLEPLPPLSAEWGNGPTSCDEMLAPEALAAALSGDAAAYDVGYAFEDSNGWDVALLTAGGFSCRYRGEGGFGGRITVLPDTAAALATIPSSAELTTIDVSGADGAGLVSCWSNGEPFEAGTGLCTVHVPIRGAWVTVLSSATGTAAEPIRAEASGVAAAIVTALG